MHISAYLNNRFILFLFWLIEKTKIICIKNNFFTSFFFSLQDASPRIKIVVALYPFKAIESGDLSLEKVRYNQCNYNNDFFLLLNPLCILFLLFLTFRLITLYNCERNSSHVSIYIIFCCGMQLSFSCCRILCYHVWYATSGSLDRKQRFVVSCLAAKSLFS
jgi:hypothetical protein